MAPAPTQQRPARTASRPDVRTDCASAALPVRRPTRRMASASASTISQQRTRPRRRWTTSPRSSGCRCVLIASQLIAPSLMPASCAPRFTLHRPSVMHQRGGRGDRRMRGEGRTGHAERGQRGQQQRHAQRARRRACPSRDRGGVRQRQRHRQRQRQPQQQPAPAAARYLPSTMRDGGTPMRRAAAAGCPCGVRRPAPTCDSSGTTRKASSASLASSGTATRSVKPGPSGRAAQADLRGQEAAQQQGEVPRQPGQRQCASTQASGRTSSRRNSSRVIASALMRRAFAVAMAKKRCSSAAWSSRVQRAVVTQRAFVQDRHAIAHRGDFGQHVGGQDHRGAGGGLLADQRAQRGDLHRIERVAGSSSTSSAGLVQQRAGQPQPLALALRQHAGEAPCQRRQFQPFDDALRVPAQRRALQSAQATVRVQMFAHRQFGHSGARSGSQPIRRRASAGCSSKSAPSSRMRPPSGASAPAIIDSVVDLPAPLTPSRPSTWPRSQRQVQILHGGASGAPAAELSQVH